MTTLDLTFRIANHEMATPLSLKVLSSTSVRDVKRYVIANWPVQGVEKPKVTNLRAVCMGQLLNDNQSLEAARIPSFDFPTPIHISVKLSNKNPSQKKVLSSSPAATPKVVQSSNSCCIIS